ncbi:MAG: hypothetical protein KAT78_00275 [Flavobacteriaceae bacterium]|nr:hypothetical protein [Flavobacteriaceae bacterium]
MKNKLTSYLVLLAFAVVTSIAYAQEESKEFVPMYTTVTTLHGVSGVDLNEWKATEQEFFDKVTSKIDLLVVHEVLISNITNDFSDIKVINVFRSWNDIQKVNAIRESLIVSAWPDEEERKLFFEKQNSFYTNYHSDEIFTSTKFGFPVKDEIKKSQKKSFAYFIQTSTLSDDNGEGSYDDYIKYIKNVFYKNSLIKGYYPLRHLWGADSRDFIEIFVVNSTKDIKNVIENNKVLLKELVPNDEKRKDFIEGYEKGILNRSNAIYVNVPSLSKG